MALPDFSMRQLLEAGAHFGHQTHRWNPKMEKYIFGSRSNIHIIDLSQTIPLLHRALLKTRQVAMGGGRILFVGTKRQARDPISAAAERCAQYYVNHRWLGGTLTNWRTVSASIERLRELASVLQAENQRLSKKELLILTRELENLELSFGGIKDMGGIPDLMFVIDTNKESIAIQEARKLNIPVIGILDTNSDPDGIAFPVPGNDDASRALQLYADLIADSVLDGLAAGQTFVQNRPEEAGAFRTAADEFPKGALRLASLSGKLRPDKRIALMPLDSPLRVHFAAVGDNQVGVAELRKAGLAPAMSFVTALCRQRPRRSALVRSWGVYGIYQRWPRNYISMGSAR